MHRRPVPLVQRLPVISSLTESPLVAFAIGRAVLLAIFMLVAELAAIAMVGIVIRTTRIGIEPLAAPHIFAGHGGAISETEFARFVNTTAIAIIAIVVAVVIAIVVTVTV